MYLSHGALGGVFPHLPTAAYPTLTTAPLSVLLNASYPVPMAYYDNTSDAGIRFTSSVPEGLEAYRFPSQMPTTENASDDNTHPTSSMPSELEAYPFLGHMPATENVGDAGIYPTPSVPGELETYPFLGQMSATENINNVIHPTSSVPGELEAYSFLSQLSATEEADFLAGHTLADPWGMAEQPNHLASSGTDFGATASYGMYHCHRSSLRLVSDAWTPRPSGFHLVRHAH